MGWWEEMLRRLFLFLAVVLLVAKGLFSTVGEDMFRRDWKVIWYPCVLGKLVMWYEDGEERRRRR